MTHTEIIDNIQTRIENLISERFTGTYFNIKIEPSNYNPNIDDTITVTITVTDQNDDPIPNWTVPLTINGTAITGTLTTNANGVATYNYTCSEWGVCRFSVKSCSTHINVTGFKQIQSNITYALYVDESSRTAQVRANRTGVTIPAGNGFEYNDFVIPTKYRPSNNSASLIMRSNQFLNYVFTNGTVGITNVGSTVTNYALNFIHEWHY